MQDHRLIPTGIKCLVPVNSLADNFVTKRNEFYLSRGCYT